MPSLPSPVVLLPSAVIFYLLVKAIYKVHFHPLAKIPGPRFAALTRLHEFYYNCMIGGGGQHTFKVQELHRLYGPCVRIGPNEVHIDGQVSPDFYNCLYNYTNKASKDQWFYYPFGADTATFATGPATLHKIRRGAISNYFSMSNIRGYEQMVVSNVEHLCKRLDDCRRQGEVVNMSDAYRCLSSDVVTSFAIPQSNAMLSSPDFGKNFHRVIRNYTGLANWERHLRFVFLLMMAVPDWVMEKTGEGGVEIVQYFRDFERQTRIALGRQGEPPDGKKMSILDTIVASPELDENDKTFQRLIGEARTIVAAGTETLGSTLTALTYYLAEDPSLADKLAQELSTAAPASNGLVGVKTLENLPYLQACINEALRISCPVTSRLPRINPTEPMTYKSPTGEIYTFPPGTILSMSMYDLHYNPDIFPEPHSFRPERWLDPTTTEMQSRYFVPFGKGSRSCIGAELARMELNLTIGNLFGGRFRFELFETGVYDVSIGHDFLAPAIPADSKGLRVRIR